MRRALFSTMTRRSLAASLAAAVLAIGVGVAAAPPAVAQERPSHTDLARFFAGMPPSDGSPLASLTQSPAWRSHAATFDEAWADIDRRQISKIRAWSAQHIDNPQATLLYMFSGPDFLYADAFFPDASVYVFAGLEPVGREPNVMAMSPSQWSAGLRQIRTAMGEILAFSFFRTRDMREDLTGGGFPGVLPIIYVFMARADKEIHAIEYMRLSSDGGVRPHTGSGAPNVLKVEFSSRGASRRQTLYYFQTNLANDGVASSGFLEWMEQLGPADAFLKSASYLPHYTGFSRIRDFIIERSTRVVQDDSGLPLRAFDRSEWRLSPFGRYVGPIELFAEFNQPAMTQLFAGAPEIDFGIGYRWRPWQSHVLLAERPR